MDDTQLDIYLVSSANRNIVIGKPHLFSIIDLYSSLICGFCLSLEPESWATASCALNHCVEDKVKYCDQYGIKIEEWEWPCHYLPGALMNDNGKVKSHHIEPIALEYGLDPLYAKAYTPVQKGKIERSHRKYNEWIRRKLPGASQDNEGERGAADYAEKACLTLEELTKIIILLTLDFNRTPVSKYPLNSELLSQDYIPSPAELWQMSLENTGGNLIMVEDKNRFRILTLPHTTRMIRQEGVQIHNLMYSSTDPRIQTVLYNNIKKSATVFYDILDIRKIYLWLDNTLYPLTLKNPYSFKDKMSLAELNFFLDRKNELYKQENFRHKCERLDTEKEINNIVDQALQESHVTTSKVNVRERKREIIQNKVNGLPEKPEITERRPAKNLYKRFDDERKKVLQEWR